MRLVFLLTLSLVLAGNAARSEDTSSCWASKRKADLRTGEVQSVCMDAPEAYLKTLRLLQLAGKGSDGQKDAAFVVRALTDESWDVRAEAARTLGMIGYADAAPELAAAISPNDWRLTFEAMVSLVKLKAPQADAILAKIKDGYWLPSVAEAAHSLAEGHSERVLRFSMMEDFATDFCNAKAEPALIPKCPASDEDFDRYKAENAVYYRSFWQKFRNDPSLKGAYSATAALDVYDGKLIGTNFGEWGGELGFVNERTTQTILEENVIAIVKRGNRIFAVTGLNHGGLNQGYIWEVLRSGDGLWTAQRIRRLPGTPFDVVAVSSGTIGLYGPFGSVLFKTDDSLQWLACGPANRCRLSSR